MCRDASVLGPICIIPLVLDSYILTLTLTLVLLTPNLTLILIYSILPYLPFPTLRSLAGVIDRLLGDGSGVLDLAVSRLISLPRDEGNEFQYFLSTPLHMAFYYFRLNPPVVPPLVVE